MKSFKLNIIFLFGLVVYLSSIENFTKALKTEKKYDAKDTLKNVLPTYGEVSGWIEYICYINFLKVSTPHTSIILLTEDDNEDHLSGKRSDDVSLMWFKSVNFKFLPVLDAKVRNEFPNLRKIIFDGRERIETELNLAAREDYSEYAKITKLEIVNFREDLKELPIQLLDHAAELLDFHANDNGIVKIPESIFWHSPKLNAVDLNGNQIKTIPAKLFAKNPKMTHIFMANNNIVTLPADLVKFNPLLEIFKVDGNAIEFMPADFYENNPSVKKKFDAEFEDEETARFMKLLKLLGAAKNVE